MRRVLENLRQKTPTERRAIAFGASAIITGFIFAVWAAGFFASIGADTVVITQKEIESSKSASRDAASPLETLRESIAGVGAAVSDLRAVFDRFGSLEVEN